MNNKRATKDIHLHYISSHGAFQRKKEKQKKDERWLDATYVRGRDK